MSTRFTYDPRTPTYAVKWDGSDRQIVLDFIQEILMDTLGWNYFDTAEEFVDFIGDKILFRSGTGIAHPNTWIYVAPGADEAMGTTDAIFQAKLVKRTS